MDGPHPLRDVAHVGRRGRHAPGPCLRKIHVAAERGGVDGEEPGQPALRLTGEQGHTEPACGFEVGRQFGEHRETPRDVEPADRHLNAGIAKTSG